MPSMRDLCSICTYMLKVFICEITLEHDITNHYAYVSYDLIMHES